MKPDHIGPHSGHWSDEATSSEERDDYQIGDLNNMFLRFLVRYCIDWRFSEANMAKRLRLPSAKFENISTHWAMFI